MKAHFKRENGKENEERKENNGVKGENRRMEKKEKVQ